MSQDIASEHRDRRVFGYKKPSQTRVGQERVNIKEVRTRIYIFKKNIIGTHRAKPLRTIFGGRKKNTRAAEKIA
jgi:hypothetical protein